MTRLLYGVTLFLAVLSSFVLLPLSAAQASKCIAFVERQPTAVPASFTSVQAGGAVEVTYIGHSTFRLRSPAGVVIATDYAGDAGPGPLPTVVTMNHAHETHFTLFPDPGIRHVLRGWNPQGGPAVHNLTLADLLIRNVSTDIRSWGGSVEPHGNSIFVFEVADLCIGHLGHLHHKLTPEHLALIGRLDVVFAPVDGSMTLDLPSMIQVLKDLRASLVIPMHYFGSGSLNAFLAGMAEEFDIRVARDPTIRVSLRSLPKQPTVLVLGGGG
ncbi:MBL fold metallo-hydrolase [Pelagibius sp. CAU 1746]|uniref:MBL fold metallo-hydrolase n=1 Tax=Pelagibius sp. CAU 1746 TaxID=3140370 RepID=UPI00325C262D